MCGHIAVLAHIKGLNHLPLPSTPKEQTTVSLCPFINPRMPPFKWCLHTVNDSLGKHPVLSIYTDLCQLLDAVTNCHWDYVCFCSVSFILNWLFIHYRF